MNKTTVIHHSADYDGLFCREIARKFLPGAELIGWDFGDAPLEIPSEGQIYILDLPVDRVFGMKFGEEGHLPWLERVIWIDHHKSSIETHNKTIPGYRIDGVAACRLAWQWFQGDLRKCTCEVPHSEGHYDYCPRGRLPSKEAFIERAVIEPLAVRLAGEYDIWDKRDPRAEVFQFGLRSKQLAAADWAMLLDSECYEDAQRADLLDALLFNGGLLQRYQQQQDASLVNHRSFLLFFEGHYYLALNTARCNSLTFAAKDVPETGHDALMGFYWNGKAWNVSLYHAAHRKDLDLSQTAIRYGGGGHRGACGFQLPSLPWLPPHFPKFD